MMISEKYEIVSIARALEFRTALITRTVISHRLNYAYRTALITRTEGRPNNAYRRYDY